MSFQHLKKKRLFPLLADSVFSHVRSLCVQKELRKCNIMPRQCNIFVSYFIKSFHSALVYFNHV